MGGGHDHGAAHAGGDQRGRLGIVLAITSVVLVVEVVGALISGSLALLADAGHLLTDVAGLTLAWFAATLARRPATEQDLEAPLSFYRSARQSGDFESAIREALPAILASPKFLYRAERTPASVAASSTSAKKA